jgi:hypothetical protein
MGPKMPFKVYEARNPAHGPASVAPGSLAHNAFS